MSKIASYSEWLLKSSLLWGGLAWLAFWVLLEQKWIGNATLDRYLLGHWIEQVTACLFFIAIAALVIKAVGLLPQMMVLERQVLEPAPSGGQPVEDCPRLQAQLEQVPPIYQQTYLIRRLHSAIEYVRRKDSSDTLEKQLRHLEEVDLDRMATSFSFVRVLLWAIPSLGFLGTVLGIAEAIGYLEFDGDSIVSSLTQVIAPLSYAFDTTALSLVLSMPVMFGKFVVEKFEEGILEAVDQRVEAELVGRFYQYGTSNDPNVAAVRRMSEQVVRTVEGMATRQAQLLRETMDDSHRHWVEITTATGQVFDQTLQATLHDALERHAQTLTTSSERQVQSLQQSLETQIDTINSGIDRQIEQMNRGIQQNVNAIENGVVNRMAMIDEIFARQIRELEQLVTKQVDILGLSIQAQADQVTAGTSDLIYRLRDGLERMAELLVEALHKHGETLTKSEEELAQENRRHLSEVEAALGEAMVVAADRQEKLIKQSERVLSEMQKSLVEAATATVKHQKQLVQQGEVLVQVVDATGQIKRLEDTLNHNLAALGRAHNFEETLLSLSAAIQLLSARMGRETPQSSVEFRPFDSTGSHAA